MPDSTEAPQVRKTLPTGPDRPRAVRTLDDAELISDLGITAPLIASAGICNHLTVTVVIVGVLDIGRTYIGHRSGPAAVFGDRVVVAGSHSSSGSYHRSAVLIDTD
jgi:hypothetical protein